MNSLYRSHNEFVKTKYGIINQDNLQKYFDKYTLILLFYVFHEKNH